MELCDISMFRHKRILYFSPHHDDAVLSSGGMLRQLSNTCEEIHLVNVFTNSLWAPNCDNCRTIGEISSCRAKENEIYCKTLHLRNTDLGFNDSMVRGYDERSELNSNYIDDLLYLSVVDKIGDILNNETYDLCFCPLAIGSHIDHQMVKNAVLFYKGIAKRSVMFYEDLPYASNIGQDMMGQIENRLSGYLNYINFDFTKIEKEKRQDISIFSSQLEENLIEKVLDYARRFNKIDLYERVWVTT